LSKTKPSPRVEAVTPFPEQALPLLWHWLEAFRKNVADDDAPDNLEDFIELELQASERGVVTFGIYRDNELGGCVWFQQLSPRMGAAHCVFKKDFFGHVTTIPALNSVAGQLFDAGIERITMQVFEHNHAIKSLIKQIGAKEEGTLREFTTQGGRPVNMVLYGLLKDEWEEKQKEER
jgi:RimJ/RimL family protein N-acetyltransferase